MEVVYCGNVFVEELLVVVYCGNVFVEELQ